MPLTYKYSQVFFSFVFILILVVFYMMLKPFLVAIIMAVTLASLFYPNFKALRRKLKGRGGSASLLMCTIITILIIIPSFLFFLALFAELNEAYGSLQTGLDTQQAAREEYLVKNPVLRELWQSINRSLGVDLYNLRTTLS